MHAVTPRRYRPRRAVNRSRRRGVRDLERGRSRMWLGVGAACTVLLLAVLALSTQLPAGDRSEGTLLAEDFDTLSPGQPWRDGERYGKWLAVYAGYGTTTVVSEGGRHRLSMSPGVASHAKTTHGGLVTTLEQFDDIDVTAQLRTERQLRPQAPNPWEVAWLVWQYTDDHHFYSIVLKPNGWELGKEDPAYPAAQRFLGYRHHAVVPHWRATHGACPAGRQRNQCLGERHAPHDVYRYRTAIPKGQHRSLHRRRARLL